MLCARMASVITRSISGSAAETLNARTSARITVRSIPHRSGPKAEGVTLGKPLHKRCVILSEAGLSSSTNFLAQRPFAVLRVNTSSLIDSEPVNGFEFWADDDGEVRPFL